MTPVAAEKIELYKSGLAKYGQQDFAGARADFERALELDPDFADVYHSLAHTLEKLEDLDGALAAARRAVELSPDEVLTHTSLSVMCMRKGLIAEAEDAKARAGELQRQQDASASA